MPLPHLDNQNFKGRGDVASDIYASMCYLGTPRTFQRGLLRPGDSTARPVSLGQRASSMFPSRQLVKADTKDT